MLLQQERNTCAWILLFPHCPVHSCEKLNMSISHFLNYLSFELVSRCYISSPVNVTICINEYLKTVGSSMGFTFHRSQLTSDLWYTAVINCLLCFANKYEVSYIERCL